MRYRHSAKTHVDSLLLDASCDLLSQSGRNMGRPQREALGCIERFQQMVGAI